jgi:hypothetical protein
VDGLEGRSFVFPAGEIGLGVVQSQRAAFLLPGVAAQGQGLIVDPPALIQGLCEEALLLSGRIDKED